MPDRRVLLVEDDQKFADLVSRALAHAGIETSHRSTGDEALHSLHAEGPFGAAVLDVMIHRLVDLTSELLERPRSPRAATG